MKKYLVIVLTLFLSGCIHQTVRHEAAFYEDFYYDDIWQAAIRAVNDIDFTIYSMDKASGFIGAESGKHIGQEAPPRLSIFISESRGRIYVDCKVLQKEQYVDLLGHGRRIARNFMGALNHNLHKRGYR
ncbi:MAG: hypothetical protein JW755_09075 [Candidatus Aminicenantes bacterium]|nr:hypothetical protein [Candidatus Aminicenantes bacterium]